MIFRIELYQDGHYVKTIHRPDREVAVRYVTFINTLAIGNWKAVHVW